MIALQSYIGFYRDFFQIFALCDDVTMEPWQPLVIEYGFFTYIMGGYLYSKFEVLSISQS